MNDLASLPPVTSALALVQQHFSLINISAEIRIVDNQEIAEVLGGRKNDINLYKRPEGQLLIKRYLETLSIASKPKEVIDQFLVDPNTHAYNEIAFSPLKTPSTTLNYWRGPTVKPAQGDWVIIKKFIFEVICNEDLPLYHYLIRYLAHMLQKPEEKPSISIVMLSNSGCGKGTFFQLLNAIWSRSTLEVADIDQVIGKFNAALEKNYIVCLDEALFKGDKASMERFKSIISEPTIRVEQKYQPSRTIDSYHRFFAASNSEHFANIPVDDRRFVFIKVSNRRQQDLRYFESIYKALNNPSIISAFVFDLFAIDLSSFNVRERPITHEHLHQRLQSLDGFERFWYEVLEIGQFRTKSSHGTIWETDWEAQIFVSTQTIIDSYYFYDKNANKYQPIQTQKISSILKKICPSAQSDRVTNSFNKQERGYKLPSLLIARQEFEQTIKMPISWNGEIETPENFDWEDEIDHDLLYDAFREEAFDAIKNQR